MMQQRMFKMYAAAGVLLLLGICWGCGTSEYERRLEKRISELKSESKFNLLASPVAVPGTSVSLRVPRDFKNPPLTEGDGKPEEARRIKPGIMELPDLKLTFEGTIEDASKGKQPYYLYVGVLSDSRKKNLPRTMRTELSGKFPNTTTDLSKYQSQTPEGGDIDWDRCRATGEQEFYYITPDGAGQFRKMSGLIELLFHEENDTLVILAWRMPTGVEQSIDFENWVKMVAGCVKVMPQ